MATFLEKEIGALEKRLLMLSTIAEESVHKSVKAVEERSRELAVEVIEADVAIDRMEVELEEECLKVLALHQPVAGDLRFIVAILKINNDLERVGDLASNIAKRALAMLDCSEVPIPFSLHEMAEIAWSMVRDSLDALVQLDPDLAQRIRRVDNEVDELHRRNYRKIAEVIAKEPEAIEPYLSLLRVSQGLERIADHATNIAEDVLYMLKGQIVRHKKNGTRSHEKEPRMHTDAHG